MDSQCRGTISNDCYHGVKGVLISPNTDLQTRQLGVALVAGTAIFGLIALAFPLYYNGDNIVPLQLHIPAAQISQASAAVTASVVAVGTGTAAPTILITPQPEPTIVTG